MKKVLFFGAIIAIAGLTSCKKDYDCNCKYNGVTYPYKLNDVKKKDAESTCKTVGNQWILMGGSCKLAD